MEKLCAVAMSTADESTEREMELYVAFLRTIAEGLMEATKSCQKKDTTAFLDLWAEVVIERDRAEKPKLQ